MFELPTSVGIRAFCDEILKEIAFEIRENLEREGVPDNKTYGSNDVVIANSTICRYTTKPNENFFRKVSELKNIEIGKFKAKKVSLITTNAICHPKKTKVLSEYYLI